VEFTLKAPFNHNMTPSLEVSGIILFSAEPTFELNDVILEVGCAFAKSNATLMKVLGTFVNKIAPCNHEGNNKSM
jgi:hypothetical protein